MSTQLAPWGAENLTRRLISAFKPCPTDLAVTVYRPPSMISGVLSWLVLLARSEAAKDVRSWCFATRSPCCADTTQTRG
jgi:hypothetical protein